MVGFCALRRYLVWCAGHAVRGRHSTRAIGCVRRSGVRGKVPVCVALAGRFDAALYGRRPHGGFLCAAQAFGVVFRACSARQAGAGMRGGVPGM
jgi:hypothetical protein